MIKFICIAAITIALTGCYQSVSIGDIKRAVYFCNSVDSEVETISALMNGAEIVTCLNGKREVNPVLPGV